MKKKYFLGKFPKFFLITNKKFNVPSVNRLKKTVISSKGGYEINNVSAMTLQLFLKVRVN